MVEYNIFGVLISAFCSLINMLGFRGCHESREWTNELNSVNKALFGYKFVVCGVLIISLFERSE